MKKIEFTDDEMELMQRLLDGEIRDLNYEVADTDTSSFRDELRQHRENVRTLLDKFGGPLEDKPA
ncbi:MAG: hypothetical protein MUP76_02695 [Acidimicrobiia bacterium]|nr:hypothetical protein [Acidimicrobiia bacterium]